MIRRIVVFTVAVLLALSARAVDIKEWPVPWKQRPRDPAVARDGTVWFVGQEGDYIGRFDPKTEHFDKIDLDKGTGPHNLIIGADNAIWFAGNGAGYIGRLDPGTGKITKYAMPDKAAGDPHTLILAPDRTIWFTVQAGGFVGHLDPKTGAIKLLKVATRGARPYGIAIDATGTVWFNQFGTNALGSIDPAKTVIEDHRLPARGARSRRIAITGDGIWYTDYARGFLSLFDLKKGTVKEWQTPAGASSLPYALIADKNGRLWLVETGPQPNRLVGFDPKNEKFFSVTEIPSGGSTVRNMTYRPAVSEIWFGTDANTIGRALLR